MPACDRMTPAAEPQFSAQLPGIVGKTFLDFCVSLAASSISEMALTS